MTGEVAILNVGAGDTKLSFDPFNPTETARAARIVKDMIRRGFVLLIEVGRNEKGPLYQRAHDFDEATHEYIIAGSADDNEEVPHDKEQASPARKGRKGAPLRRVPAAASSAVTVARTAGG